MDKKKREILLVVFVLLVLTFFLSSVSALSTSTFNFNNASTVFTGGEDFDQDPYPPDNTLPPDSAGSFSVTDKNRMKSIDGSYATSGIPDDAEGYILLNSSVGNGIVTALNWSWYGHFDDSDTDNTLHYFLWNVTGSKWYECLSNSTEFASNTWKSCYVNSGVSDFITADKRSYFMLWGTDPDDLNSFGSQISTDYAELKVTTDSVSMSIIAPTDFEEFNTNLSLPLNFTISGPTSTIWWNLDNGANTTITQNVTFNTSDGSHVLYLFANDTDNNLFTDSVSFTVSLSAPSITLDYPDNATYFRSKNNIYLNYTAIDSNGISMCQVWHDLTGTFALNQTNTGVTSGLQNFTIINASTDGTYKWNIFCNDTTAQSRFSALNRTFFVDSTYPTFYNISVQTSAGSQTINFTYNVNETNDGTCKYSILDSLGAIDGLNNNISITCESQWEAVVSAYGNFTLRLFSLDLAGNENSTDYNFTTSQLVAGDGGGGGGGSGTEGKDLIPVIGLANLDQSSKTYTTLEREVMYAKINSYCSTKKSDQLLAIEDLSGECVLNINDLKEVNKDILALGISVDDQDLIDYYKQYTNKQLFQGFEEEDTIKKYGLFTSVLGIPNPMTIFPSTFRAPVFRFAPGDNITIEKVFLVNKNIRECAVTKGNGDLKCEIITNTTFKMIYTINNTDFFDKTFTGELSVTSDAKAENLEVKPVPISLNVYNFSGKIVGIPVSLWIGGLLIIFIVGGLVLINSKRFRNKLFRRRRKK